MIDLEALRQAAGKDDGDCVVERCWLRQVLHEIEAGREAAKALAHAGETFGLRREARL